ncbi:MAG: hypothetical protein EXR78_02685 [Deltaproteobacteria bacterium]|nr:hypothetical protein [Deltaproteobacteria bacterium]
MNLWTRLRNEFAHAFALQTLGRDLTPEELALLEKVAAGIVRRGMADPAVLFLESLGPLNFLGSQVLHGLIPFLELVCDPTELERLANILERRESVEHLSTLITEKAVTA